MQLYELQKLGAESREFQTVGRNKLEEVDGMENDGTSKVNIEYIVMETHQPYYAETYLKKTEELPQDLSVRPPYPIPLPTRPFCKAEISGSSDRNQQQG